jgi:hypothetical protein
MIYLIITSTFLFTACLALAYLVRDLSGQRDFWRNKQADTQAELTKLYQANADANMRRLDGHRVFSPDPKPQEPVDSFELGHDRAESQRQAALMGMTSEDEKFLDESLQEI